jgi:hypothetical protein
LAHHQKLKNHVAPFPLRDKDVVVALAARKCRARQTSTAEKGVLQTSNSGDAGGVSKRRKE